MSDAEMIPRVLITNEYERTCWVVAPPTQAHSAILFLDAELYRDRVRAPEVVGRLMRQGVIPPAVSVYLSNGGAAARHADYVCSDDYARYVSQTLVGQIEHDYPTVCDWVIVGLSLSGLAAAHVATRFPNVFRVAICQSPSFWWERGQFARDLPAATREDQEFWTCVGSLETSAGVSHAPSGLRQDLPQIEGCDVVAAAFRAKGYRLSHREYEGGHDPDCWRDDLALALAWAWRHAES